MSLVPVEEALRRLLDGVEAVTQTETIGLRDLANRVLAEDLHARRSQPSFDASAMDGYAVGAEDLREGAPPLRLIGESAAGRPYEGPVEAGETVRIFTGAPVPKGANAVLIQEDAQTTEDGRIAWRATVAHGQNIRPSGNDFTAGNLLVPAGTMFRPASIALAASGGYDRVPVLRRPRVAIAATGDELVPPDVDPAPSQIVACNGYAISALAETAGGTVLDFGIVPDSTAELNACFDRALSEDVDVLVTIGGASVGDHDLVGPTLRARGAGLAFWKIAMRPGKPLMAGRLERVRVLGLPGNPASSIVTSELFLVPLVERLAGRPSRDRYQSGVLGRDLPANDHRAEFMRSRLSLQDGRTPVLTPFPRQDSSLLSVFADADALVYRPPHAPAAVAGEECRYLLLS